MEGLLDDIYKFASLVPRVAKNSDRTDYLCEVDEIIELAEIRDEILRRVDAVIHQVRYIKDLMGRLEAGFVKIGKGIIVVRT